MEQQTKLTPQMKHYEDFAGADIRWMPYVMFYNRTDYRSPAINTDSAGFRITETDKGPVSLGEPLPEGEVSLILGASTAFGFGATADSQTIPSLLSQGEGTVPWLNLAAPAFNSTQELILFLMHRHSLGRVRDIVVFSGLNNLVVSGLPGADEGYGQFFFSGPFFRQLGIMTDQFEKPGQQPGKLARAARRIGLGGGPDKANDADKPALADPEARIEVALRNAIRDLDTLQYLAVPTGARVRYVLQPTASWSGKSLTPEEKLLIEENYTERGGVWDLFRQILEPSVHSVYSQALADACKTRGIDYLDLNAAFKVAPNRDSWLFTDQPHLNDEGNRLAVDIMNAELGLNRPA
ncbi:IopA [Streptomyces sp. NPDC058653]|uniref:IopA n=1 Tax=Streptomyces sp. NPDC058653 TaxID=3346576 RepID=UPI00365B502F